MTKKKKLSYNILFTQLCLEWKTKPGQQCAPIKVTNVIQWVTELSSNSLLAKNKMFTTNQTALHRLVAGDSVFCEIV